MEKAKKPMTIYSVACEAGVSMATVSRVVNDNPNVKSTTRRKVLEAIRRLDYRPNAVARGLARKKTTLVGMVLPDISQVAYAELARGVEDVAAMYGYGILLSSADTCSEREIHSIGVLRERRVDGVLFLGGSITPAHRSLFSIMDVPVVLMAMYDSMDLLPHVAADGLKISREATEILLEEGHRQVGFLGATAEGIFPQEQGYREALRALGRVPHGMWIRRACGANYAAGYRAMQELLRSCPSLSAAVVANDTLSAGALHAVLDLGRSLPEDFSLIGLGDPLLTHQLRPLLSSVGVSLYDVGAVAMRLLMGYMSKENMGEKSVILPHRVALRGSTRLRTWTPSIYID
ncbi:substrate-binding domain-containing protein [Pasteuria penetrans]|uniref:substrate-binding domain-containing protein n=1 Tax=Pasteuria penetrans TaxID=86005 RepID=UPI0011ED4A10|nr:substrate-binding domain-containing protein [Pasteuria penetrans]